MSGVGLRTFVLLLLASPAYALTQPNGAAVPSPPGCDSGKPTGLAAVLACACVEEGVCNIGAPCASEGSCDDGQRGSCETTLAHAFNDNTCIPSKLSGLDPYSAASTTPETFRPTCALTFSLESRGTARFGNVFGWYNVGAGKPTDLYPMLDCDDPPGTRVVLDVQGDARWKGGEIGFFLLTPESTGGQCAGGDCCASLARHAAGVGHVFYSQRAYNPDAAGAQSLIHLLVLDSRITPAKFYFAWEDILGATNNDFTDLVTAVEGVECSGGGLACETGRPGACATGISACDGAELTCRPLVEAAAEECNGVDDDCDGAVDDGATCPNAQICTGGRCIGACNGGEFDCLDGTVCDMDTGRCVDPDCTGVVCPEGQVCRDGRCGDGCQDVVCPGETTCVLGECLARCDGVSCPGGQVCREGLCFPACDQCGGLACAGATVCSAGRCLDPGCPAGCADGSHCADGVCVDDCEGAVCPAGQVCAAGRCHPPGQVVDAGPGDDPGADDDGTGRSSVSSCGCRSGGEAGTGATLMLVLFLLYSRRHRRLARAGAGQHMRENRHRIGIDPGREIP